MADEIVVQHVGNKVQSMMEVVVDDFETQEVQVPQNRHRVCGTHELSEIARHMTHVVCCRESLKSRRSSHDPGCCWRSAGVLPQDGRMVGGEADCRPRKESC